ncbi:bifunctional adenosylcobinamide kinase/adenosylcobinamide-phosphate guanylyltransferase [Neobacillus kokaensis]|uniref:bifunctional adenosylcobinamide kinase/adenosylcobinamide-phosphate guanylyltransferase n=1 Tax=Neobacillus kokaensis TaxID=2759023 RepID=UPI001CB8C068|nr:bifunctional adenosylcobinamide kinase/adenosylcobinamide-phosphate guanylyltransferase [Neobacillus kokaensis]
MLSHNASLIFITGGVRSGKSSFAEKHAEEIAIETGGQLNYLATGVPSDPEMTERIEKHQRDRETGECQWKTVERSVHIGELVSSFNSEDIVLLDCVTTLLNNELFSRGHVWDNLFLTNVQESVVSGILKLKNQAKALIVVSNEVLNEPLAGNELVFTYGKLLGRIHQELVKEADQAFLVEAGVPVLMKGVQR